MIDLRALISSLRDFFSAFKLETYKINMTALIFSAKFK